MGVRIMSIPIQSEKNKFPSNLINLDLAFPIYRHHIYYLLFIPLQYNRHNLIFIGI